MAVETDPITGYPLGQSRQAVAEEQLADEKRIKRQAGFINELESEQGRSLIDHINTELLKRIRKVLESDEVAGEYLKMLKVLGSQKAVAEMALQELHKHYAKTNL